MPFPLLSLLLFGSSLLFVSGEVTSSPRGPAGIKMTVRYSMDGSESQETTYFRANARRLEFRNLTASKYGPHLAFIERCDLGEALDLNLDLQQYDSRPFPPFTKEQLARMEQPPQPVTPGPPTSRIEETTVDSGERKDFFGHQARYVVIFRKETPLAGSHRYAQETVTRGWYIDLDVETSCEPWWRLRSNRKGFAYLTAGNAPERVEFVQKGMAETGFAVDTKTVEKSSFSLRDGSTQVTTSKSRFEVVDFMEGPLGADVFEAPPGFKKVERINWNQPGGERSALSVGWQQFVLTIEDFFN